MEIRNVSITTAKPEFFTGAGFDLLLSDAWYPAADIVAILDTGTTNVMEFAGRLVPIDTVPVRPGGFMQERILEALGVPVSLR